MDKIRSYSKPGESPTIRILKDSSRVADVPATWYAVRKRDDDTVGNLPSGVGGPLFNDDFGDVYGVIDALESDGFSNAEVKLMADDVRRQLRKVTDVNKVKLFGKQDEKVYVGIAQKRLNRLGLAVKQVLALIIQQNAVEYAGTVQTPLDVIQVRVAGRFQSVQQLRDLPIQGSSCNQIRLSDIAEVKRGYRDPPDAMVRHQGRQVIALGVSMVKGGDIFALGMGLGEVTQRSDARLPAGPVLVQLQDQSRAVSSSVNEFVKVLIEAVLIVLVVSFVSPGMHYRPQEARWYRRYHINMRPGLIVGITLPLVLAVTFLGMYHWGTGLHKISPGFLIISLGLLVDDAIIAVGMVVREVEDRPDRADPAVGVDPWNASVESTGRRLCPIVATATAAAAAVLAMIPPTRPIFRGPMAVAIMGGLLVATVLTLLPLPAMYAAWLRVQRPVAPAG